MTDTNSQQFSCGSAEITEWQLIATEPKYLFTVLYRGGACTGASCKLVNLNHHQYISVSLAVVELFILFW